jgi:hypothetical protein
MHPSALAIKWIVFFYSETCGGESSSEKPEGVLYDLSIHHRNRPVSTDWCGSEKLVNAGILEEELRVVNLKNQCSRGGRPLAGSKSSSDRVTGSRPLSRRPRISSGSASMSVSVK